MSFSVPGSYQDPTSQMVVIPPQFPLISNNSSVFSCPLWCWYFWRSWLVILSDISQFRFLDSCLLIELRFCISQKLRYFLLKESYQGITSVNVSHTWWCSSWLFGWGGIWWVSAVKLLSFPFLGNKYLRGDHLRLFRSCLYPTNFCALIILRCKISNGRKSSFRSVTWKIII